MAGQEPKNDPNAQNKSLLATDGETDSETRRIHTKTVAGANYLLTSPDTTTSQPVDTELPTAAALADDESSTPTVPRVGAIMQGMDSNGGDNLDRMRLAKVHDLDSGAATEYAVGVSKRVAASGGSIPETYDAGVVAAGTQRITLGSNDPAVTALQIMDDWDESDRAKVNLIAGQAGIAGGTGTDGATVPRVTLATNVPLPAGTNGIGKLTANSGVDIGDVDVTSAVITGGAIADDSTTPGNPVMVGGSAKSNDGTTPTAVAENDVVRFITDLNRRLYVNAEHPQHWSFHSDGSSALTDSTVQADPGDGFEIVITEIKVSTGAATAMNVFLEEGSTKIWGPDYLEATAGRGFQFKVNKHVTPSTAVTITTSAAIAQSIDIQGYIQAV